MNSDGVRGGDKLVAVARAAIGDCGGAPLVERALAGRTGEALLVVGAGKAVGAMASGAAAALAERYLGGPLIGKHPLGGAPPVVARWLRPGSHPVPDERSERGARELLAAVAAADRSLLVLLSGGASALLSGPVDGVPLSDVQRVTQALLASGQPIARLNCVRKHLCVVLGGRLAAARRQPPPSLLALALSDVVGDDPATIGSGPVSPDPTTFAEAVAAVRAAGVVDGPALAHLEAGARGEVPETPKAGDPRLDGVEYRILATPVTLRARAAERARAAGLLPRVEERLVEGDVVALAAHYLERGRGLGPGEVLVAVGEPTVRLSARPGRGGRSQQLALDVGLRLHQAGERSLAFAAIGSDGSDGPTEAAGAFIDAALLADPAWSDAGEQGARAALERNDAFPLLARLGALVHTGPTGTNLLDLHLLARC